MLNISLLACIKVELKVNGEKFQSHDLDLGLTIPNIELVRAIFIYYNIFKFHVPRSISF